MYNFCPFSEGWLGTCCHGLTREENFLFYQCKYYIACHILWQRYNVSWVSVMEASLRILLIPILRLSELEEVLSLYWWVARPGVALSCGLIVSPWTQENAHSHFLHWPMAMRFNLPFGSPSVMYSLWGEPPPHVDIIYLVRWWLVRRHFWWIQLILGVPCKVWDWCDCALSWWMVLSTSNWGIGVRPGCHVRWCPHFRWWNFPWELSAII